MALSELQRQNLPLRQKLSLLAQRGFIAGQTRVTNLLKEHGLLPVLLSLMVITTCIRLLWTTAFPLAWWITLDALVVFECLEGKMVWPKDRPIQTTVEEKPNVTDATGQL